VEVWRITNVASYLMFNKTNTITSVPKYKPLKKAKFLGFWSKGTSPAACEKFLCSYIVLPFPGG
jgi:hypothetical protein